MSSSPASAAPRPARGDLGGAGLVLLTCCFSLFMAQLDATAVNVALPAIGRDLGGGISGLQWVVDGYVLVLASLAMSGGAAGDRFGRRRVYRTGLAVFSLGSLGCSLAPSLASLIGLRVVQAAGASMLMPVTLSIIANTYRSPAARSRAIGVWAGISGLAAAAGPLVGGALTSAVGWRAIFWINLPIGAIALLLTARQLRESRAARPRALDLTGQILLSVTLAALTYALIEAPGRGWAAPETLALLGASAAGGWCFVAVEARVPGLLEPRFFRIPSFSGATAMALLGYLALMGFLFVNSLYLQQIRGLTPLAAGAALLPASLALAAASPVAGRLTARHGPRPVLAAASASIGAALAVLTQVTETTPLAVLALAYLLIGAGWGLLNPPLTSAAIAAMPADQAGVASATAGAARQVGAVLGVAVMGSLAAARLAGLPHGPGQHASGLARVAALAARGGAGGPARAAFMSGTRLGYAVGLAAALVCLILAVAAMGRDTAPPAARAPDARRPATRSMAHRLPGKGADGTSTT